MADEWDVSSEPGAGVGRSGCPGCIAQTHPHRSLGCRQDDPHSQTSKQAQRGAFSLLDVAAGPDWRVLFQKMLWSPGAPEVTIVREIAGPDRM